MPFTGLSTHGQFAAGPLNGEDVARQIALLSVDETPLLDWLGDPDRFALDTKHDFIEEELRPNYITTSTAINSATAATGIQLQDFGDLLTVGTLLENESASPEVMQVTSIAGSGSILVSRAFGGGAVGSLAPGQTLFVRGNYALEGADHPGGDVSRKRRRKTTYLGLFHIPVAISGSQDTSKGIGVDDEFEHQTTNRLKEALRDLEKEVIRGVLSGNSMGSNTAYRTFEGLRSAIASINSTVTASSFAANPHLYLGNVWEQAFQNGASETETWGIVAGRTYFRNISDMNDSKVQDSNKSEQFKRVIRDYAGPFGNATVFLSRWLPATSAILVPRERVKVVPKQGRSFHIQEIAKTGDNRKRLVVGEYGVEIHHSQAMAQLKS
jgi:hypothetical protein